MGLLFREVENKGIDCRLFGFIMEAEELNGCHDLIDLYYVSVGPGEVELEIPVSASHLNTAGVVHGGIIANLADSAIGMAMRSLNKSGVTTNLSVNFLKSATRGDVLKATGIARHDGRKMFFGEAKIYNQRGDLLAIAQGSFFNTCEFLENYLKVREERGIGAE